MDDWYATGMSATGSNTIVADNVFVPAHRCLPLPDMLEARYLPGTMRTIRISTTRCLPC